MRSISICDFLSLLIESFPATEILSLDLGALFTDFILLICIVFKKGLLRGPTVYLSGFRPTT
jgi:hypothetical protein